MTWDTTMTTMLRVLVNDTEATQVYTDDRIKQILVVAAQLVTLEVTFDNTYTVTIGVAAAASDISPDPVALDDDPMINLTVLRAACITDFSTFRTKALQSGIEAKCGPATLKTLKHLDGFKQLLDSGPCAAYEIVKQNWVLGNGELCRAIMTPFVSNSFDPRGLSSGGANHGLQRGRYYMDDWS